MIASITLLVIIAMLCAGFFAGILGVPQNSSEQLNTGLVEENLLVQNCAAVKTAQNLNISFTINCQSSEGIPIDGFQINGVSTDDIPGCKGYLNGSAFGSGYSPLLVMLKSETLQVNLVLPSAFSDPRTDSGHVKVNVMTPDATYYAETSYP
jgi:hypothetical protein